MSNQRGYLMSYVLTALAFIAIATAMYAGMQVSQGDTDLSNRELDQMVRVVSLLHSGLMACGSCGGNTSVASYGNNLRISSFVPGIRTNSQVGVNVSGDVGNMACPNIKDPDAVGRFIWNNLDTTTSASRSVLGVPPPRLSMFTIQYELVASGQALDNAKFTFTQNDNARNPQDLYRRFVLRVASKYMTTTDLVFDGGYASNAFVMKTSPDFSQFHIQCQ